MLASYSYNFPQKKNNLQLNSLYYCLTLLQNTEVRGFRSLFGQTVNGQRTNSNGSTASRTQSTLFRFKYGVMSSLSGSKITKPIFLAEYINLFWQHQWVFEWVSSYNSLKRLPIYVQKTNFIDISAMNRFYIYHQYNSPFKRRNKSSQKRKKVIPKNKYSTGLPFGFSLIYSKQLHIIS